jgi:hypothetical protein
MIAHLQGRLVEKTPTDVVIDCNGVGYQVNISLHTFSLLPDSENIKLYTFLLVKEDSHTLLALPKKPRGNFLSCSFLFREWEPVQQGPCFRRWSQGRLSIP